LVFENSSLERDKMELLRRIEQLKSENERFEYSLEKQHEKINELERKKEDLEKMNFDHISTIESLRISNQDYA
jgi:predicted RNase H-like nuclease (RuvC/YqgF family)